MVKHEIKAAGTVAASVCLCVFGGGGRLRLFEQTTYPNKCGQGSTVAVAEEKREEEGGEKGGPLSLPQPCLSLTK